MDSSEEIALGALGIVLCLYAALDRSKIRAKRRFKVRPVNRHRKIRGGYQYFKKINSMDDSEFFKYTRMNHKSFEKLFKLLASKLQKQKRSDTISPQERLVITLQYLSQGTTMKVLACSFQIGLTTVHKIILETCDAIWDVLNGKYLKSPQSEEEWLNISQGFYERWNFPNCVGALDGKHVNIRAPPKSLSLLCNYKKNFSIVLLAACDSEHKFTLIDIGAYGSQSDGGIFKHSIFGQHLENRNMNLPSERNLPKSNIKMNHFFVAAEAFPLKEYVMRPYPGKHLTFTQQIFNYRLSRARQAIEITFGILSARWRILKTTINANVDNVDKFVKAVVVLHNFCQIELKDHYCPPGYADEKDEENGHWRTEEQPLQSVGRLSANMAKRSLYLIRDRLAEYFVSDEGKG